MNDYWKVYLLKCSDSTLYTGITKNLQKRLQTHNSGKGSKYTRGRTPVSLICYTYVQDKSEALSLELNVKKVKKETFRN